MSFPEPFDPDAELRDSLLESPSSQYKIKCFQTGETNYFVKYESEQEETFKSKTGIVVKLWISKKEFSGKDEEGNVVMGVYPPEITVTIG